MNTPAPWTLAEANNTIPIKGANGRTVASVRYNEHYDLSDATLIAAAPDLLSALQAYLEADLRGHSTIEGRASVLARARKEAYAAIAKATNA